MIPFIMAYYGKSRKLTTIKYWFLAICSIFIIWALVNSLAIYTNHILNKELYTYDLNGDGTFTNEEITPEVKILLHRMSSDTARTFAPISGIIVGLFFTLIGFGITQFVFALVTKNNDKYSSSKRSNKPINTDHKVSAKLTTLKPIVCDSSARE